VDATALANLTFNADHVAYVLSQVPLELTIHDLNVEGGYPHATVPWHSMGRPTASDTPGAG
jgi:hypothetical protein